MRSWIVGDNSRYPVVVLGQRNPKAIGLYLSSTGFSKVHISGAVKILDQWKTDSGCEALVSWAALELVDFNKVTKWKT